MAEIKKCKWAGDEDDNLCKECNGVEYLEDGKTVKCTSCPGYEAGDETVEEPKAKEPEPKKEEKPKEEVKQPKEENKTTNNKKEGTTEKSIAQDCDENDGKIEVSREDLEKYGIKIKSIRYQSSRTVKVGDDYFKFSAEEEWDVENSNPKDNQIISDMLWTKLAQDVDEQVKNI